MVGRAMMAGLVCVCAAGGLVWLLTGSDGSRARRPTARRAEPGAVARAEPVAEDPNEVFVEPTLLEDSGLGVVGPYSAPIRDWKTLAGLRESIVSRGRLAVSVLRGQVEQTHLDEASSKSERARAGDLRKRLGLAYLYEGRFEAADGEFAKAAELAREAGVAAETRQALIALRGIAAMRRGEVDNCIMCLGPSSCIFPIASEAAHTRQTGSRKAIEFFTAYLAERPGDLRVRWLLNLAYMTLDEYPDKVPAKYRISLDSFKSKVAAPRFDNVAATAGLTSRGPNDAGGSLFDDFTGDGKPDLLTTSLDGDRGASLYVNLGDGNFEDRSESAGLTDQVYGLNLTRADYDNDGDLDVLILRGGWEKPMRMSLLRNRGHGVFEDVTLAAGMGEPIQTEAAAWADYDDDGLVDLFVCGEYSYRVSGVGASAVNENSRCRLYKNMGDGTFRNVAAEAGVDDAQYSKGCAWGDYDADGRIDLYVSTLSGSNRLYHNDGDGRFHDVGGELGVDYSNRSFACWFWDYDNDGRLDLYVNEYGTSLAETAAIAMGLPLNRASRPRLYKNVGKDGFREVSAEVGLDVGMAPMGCNFGDIDNDGDLDMYFGTGMMAYEHLVPNLMFMNIDGKRFEDVTTASGTGHLQKGHGVSFADYDDDGDLDLFVEAGGATPGDKAFNLLFRNPTTGKHWLKVHLTGTRTNRSAIGARIKATVRGADGAERTIYRTVGNNSSFGGNPLVQHIGLGDATKVESLEITWPTSRATQTVKDVAIDRTLEVREEGSGHPPTTKSEDTAGG